MRLAHSVAGTSTERCLSRHHRRECGVFTIARARAEAFWQVCRGRVNLLRVNRPAEHLRGYAGHDLTRHEPLRVGAQIIGNTRNDTALAASQCLQSNVRHLGGSLSALAAATS